MCYFCSLGNLLYKESEEKIKVIQQTHDVVPVSILRLCDVSDIVQTSYRRWNDAVYLLGNSDTDSTYTVSKWSPVTKLSIVDYGHEVYWELYWIPGS